MNILHIYRFVEFNCEYMCGNLWALLGLNELEIDIKHIIVVVDHASSFNAKTIKT